MRRILIILLSVVLLDACKSQQAKQDLGLRLEAGKNYKQLMSSKATIDQDVSGQKMNMVMTMTGAMNYLVKAVNSDGYDMEVSYDSLSMTMTMPNASMNFSSEKPSAADVFSTILSRMKNRPFMIKMSKSGKITEVKNIDRLFDSAFNAIPGAPEFQLQQIRSQLMQSYGEDAFKGNIEMVTAIFPENQVQQGDSWAVKTKIASGMTADLNSSYKLLENSSDKVLIQGKSVIVTTNKDSYTETNGMPIRYDINGTMTSDINVDPKTGWILEAKISQVMSGNAHIKENPQIPNGMTIPMTMKSEVMVTSK